MTDGDYMQDNLTCWRKMIFKEINKNDDQFVAWTLNYEESEKLFNPGYGAAEGCSFTAWGEKYVYFPIVYDGSEWVGSDPRNPCNQVTHHMGGQ